MADVKKDLQRLAAQPTGSCVSLPLTQRAVNLPLPPTQLARVPPLNSTYAGQAYNRTLNTTVNIILTFAQNQDKISGFCSVELLFGGSGPFTGTIDIAGRVKFNIQANDGSGTITAAIGTIQPDGSLRGSYMAENLAAQGMWFARPVRTPLP